MTTNRRFGPRDSVTSNAILDATERVLRDQGYGAVSSRSIAREAGIRQGLVYYYFKTMDDVLLATFKRRTERALERMENETGSDKPIQTMWHNLMHQLDTRVIFEFVALANHHEGIRDEVNRFLTQTRRLQTEAVARQAERNQVDLGDFTPSAIVILMYTAALMLAREESAGITEGHADVHALFKAILSRFA